MESENFSNNEVENLKTLEQMANERAPSMEEGNKEKENYNFSIDEAETNDAAEKKAADLPTAEETVSPDEKTAPNIRSAMTKKASRYLRRVERVFADNLSRAAGVSGGAGNESTDSIVTELVDKYLTTGKITDEDVNKAYERIYSDVEAEGGEGEIYRLSKHNFRATIMDMKSELKRVKASADESWEAQRESKKEKADSKAKFSKQTTQEIMKMYETAKQLRKDLAKVESRTLLSEKDEEKVGELLRGEIEEKDVRGNNRDHILEVYKARSKYAEAVGEIQRYKNMINAERNAKAKKYLETSLAWKDKKAGIFYARETQERNIMDIVDDPEVGKEIIQEYFAPVHHATAEATRLKNQMREEVRKLNISHEVKEGNSMSESAMVQLLGEGYDNIEAAKKMPKGKKKNGKTLAEWVEQVEDAKRDNPNMDYEKIGRAVQKFRELYDELIVMLNETRVRNGYEPISYRKAYFPHFMEQEGDSVLSAFGRTFGIRTDITALPTSINGMTHTFKPGIRWFANALTREGNETKFDALEGFDRYIEAAADIIYQTDNIQNLRALTRQLRTDASDGAIKEKIENIINDPELDEEQKDELIRHETDARFALSNYVVNLDEYTNLLANKKSLNDRNMEYNLGRQMYNVVKTLEGRVAKNMVASNISSAFTNFAPIVQSNAQTGTIGTLRGMLGTLKSMLQDDGITAESDFLTNRIGSNPLVMTKTETLSQKAGFLMEAIDQFTAGSIVRARYYQNLQNGMDMEMAMRDADATAAGIMADRSKGAMPTLFEQKNPLVKAFTAFQLEPNNTYSWFKDLYRDKKTRKALVNALFTFFLGAFLYNEFYEKAFGRRPVMDPIGMLNDFAGDLSGYQVPNLVDMGSDLLAGQLPSFETEKEGLHGAVSNLAANAVDQLPFASLADALLTGDADSGLVPIGSAVPNVTNVFNAATNENYSPKKKMYEIGSELAKPVTYLLPPFGGGQVKKTLQGLEAVLRGGVYGMSSDGEEELKYPVYSESIPGAILNTAKAVLAGKSSLPTALDWDEAGYPKLSAKQTACYKAAVEIGESERDTYDLIIDIRSAEGTDEMTKSEAQRMLITESDLSGDGKAIVYYSLLASDREMDLIREAADAYIDLGKTVQVLTDLHDVDGADEKLDLLSGENLNDTEAELFAGYVLGKDRLTEKGDLTKYGKLAESIRDGMSGADALRLTSDGVDLGEYLDMRHEGVSAESAQKIVERMNQLDPLPGSRKVSNAQKWRVAVDETENVSEAMAALKTIMADKQYEKMAVGTLFAVDPDLYVYAHELLPMYDRDDNGRYSGSEVKAAIDAMNSAAISAQRGIIMTKAQKAALWQIMTGSTSAKNNPYSVITGEKVINAGNRYEGDTEK